MTMSDNLRRQWHSSTNVLVNEIRIQLQQHSNRPSDKAAAATTPTSDANNNNISSISNKWYDKIVRHYSESHREYHNLIHIEELLASIDLLLDTSNGSVDGASSNSTMNNAILTVAAFFHDVIYNPKSSTNEKDSADLFLEFVSELSCSIALSVVGIEWNDDIRQSILRSNTTVIRIEQCIIATATHISSANQARLSNDTIAATFLDADMSILGRDPSRYDTYAASIRREYEFVERDMYCEKRAEILESFLPLMTNTKDADTPTASTLSMENVSSSKTKEKQHYYVYATDRGRALWEDRARQNLKREIDMLRRGFIPCEESD